MVTIRDVAERAAVSPSTVSHVINKTRHVSAETRQRVLQAMAELHYQPNRLARSLRSRRTQTLGVLLPNNANPFFAQVLEGIEAAGYDCGYNVILGNANDDPQRELAYLDTLLSKQVDGVLLVSTGAYREALDFLAARETPVVMVDRSPGEVYEDFAIDTVFTENQRGGLLATEYLIGLGHCRIGCIAGPSLINSSAARVAGYRQALQAAGLPLDERLLLSGDFMHEGGYRAAKALLELKERPSALFVCNDLMAVGALYAAHEAGLRVPDDVSVIGFDDIPLASFTLPRLTTIAQPARELGARAVALLVKRLQDRQAPACHELLPVHLVERDSCQHYTGRDS
ncbi:MAG: LacI family DNA-binding transcriptional regulator [Anaerolineae bacterium]|nr:LacI family DNA-binding transcriptional regulator [Anaerolineae bacterium]